MFGPFLWMLLTAVKSVAEASAFPPTLWPRVWEWGNFVRVFEVVPFGTFYWNSTISTLLATAGQIGTSALAGYAFARLRFWGRDTLFFILLTALLIPFQVIMAPLVGVLSTLHWLNTYTGLIVPNVPSIFGTFLFRQFFMGIPIELEEAARMDGAGRLRILYSVVMPLSLPVVAAFGILSFLYNWNNLFYQLLVVSRTHMMTLPLGLTEFNNQYAESSFNLLMAASTLAVAPILVVYFWLQRYFIEGIALSGVK